MMMMGKKSDKVTFTFSEGGSLENMADVPQSEMTTIKQETLNRILEHGGEMMEEIAALKAENEALRAVAVAAVRLSDIVEDGQSFSVDMAIEASLELAVIAQSELAEAIATARAAGYLADEQTGEEVRP